MAITLNGTGSGFNRAVINDNFQKIEDELNNNVLRRGNVFGNEDNAMREDLDMNSQRILNLPRPENPYEPARLIDLSNIIGDINVTPSASDVEFDGDVDYIADNVELALELEAALRANIDDNLQLLEGNVQTNNGQLVQLDTDVTRLQNEMVVVQQRSLNNLASISSLSNSKANRDQDAVENNVAIFDSLGNPVDSGVSVNGIISGSIAYVQEEAPTGNIADGARWYIPSEATTYVWYVDSDGGQWVQEITPTVPTDEVPIALSTLVFSSNEHPVGRRLEVSGREDLNPDGFASWIKTSETGTPSQTPAQRGDGKLTDANGAVWVIYGVSFVTPEMLGAAGDGVTDDGLIVRSLFKGYRHVWIKNDYFLDSPVYDAVANWRHHAIVYENTTVVGNGSIFCSTPFSSRAVALLVRGSKVSIDGITIEDKYTAASPFLIGIGCGSAYDSSFNMDLRRLFVTNCTFNSNWLSVTAQMLTGTGTIRNVRVKSCDSVNLPTSGSGGNYNFRSPYNEYLITDVHVAFCTAENGTTASSYNFFSISDFKVISCKSKFNRYAGTEAENGSKNGQIIGFTSYDDCYGVWIDDSKDIQVSKLIHETVTSNYITPILGTLGLVRSAVRITKQGFQDNVGFQTTNIQVDGVISKNGSFYLGVFGENPQGDFGRITVKNWTSRSNGSSGTVGFSAGGSYNSLTLRNIDVAGFSDRCVSVTGSSGSVTFMDDIKTFNVLTEDSLGLEFVGTGKLYLDGAYVQSESIVEQNNEIRSLFVGGSLVKERLNNQSMVFGYVGSPENNVEAGTGSVVHRVDDGAMYIKATGIGNTGWKRVATV